jgi:general secretion pathway protein K
LPTLPVEGGSIHVSIEDAQGRFNLNDLLRNNAASAPDIEIFRRLLVVLSLQPALADALVDWIDADGEARPAGAEDIEYLNGKPSYRTGNQRLASVEELRLVRGFDAKTLQTLLPFVTALPPAAGRTPINVNTAKPEVLAAVANKDLAWAQREADNLRDTPMRNPGEVAKLLQLPAGAAPPLTDVKTSFFLITLDTSIGRHQRQTVALMQRDGKGTNWIWHKPQPLIDAAGLRASTGTDESAEPQ